MLRGCLSYAKIDDVRYWFTVQFGDQDVRRLQIEMDDGFLVSVLNALANRDK